MNILPITVNGYNTYYIDHVDCKNPHLLIAVPPNAEKDIAQICGTVICEHLITGIDYNVIDGTRFIIAYY